MSRKLRTSFVVHPSAILFLLISRKGVFQQPRLVMPIAKNCNESSEGCTHRNFRWKFHLGGTFGNGIFLVVPFINVEVRDNEASRLVVNEFPRAHILYSLFGEHRVAGQEFYVCYLVAVSGDLHLHHALQAH